METNNKASTSRFKTDSSDEDDEHHDNLSTEELCRKKKTSRNLCLGNIINVNNASSKSTTRIDDDNNFAVPKPKRQNLMLTTHEKLTRTPAEDEKYILNQALMNHMIPTLNYNELFPNRPSRYFNSLFYDLSLAEEMKMSREMYDKKEENDATIEVDKSFLHFGDIISRGVMCPEFHAFVAERDKADHSIDDQLSGIEYRFDPNNHQFINNSEYSISDEPDNNKRDNKDTVFDGLLACIDNVDREYSFFNPKLLANWNGPKEWKAQAMAKALKSCTPNERKDILLNSNINLNIDESTQQNIKQFKTFENRDQVKSDSVKIDWLDKKQIKKRMKKNDSKYTSIIPRNTLKKWNSLHNMIDIRNNDIIYKCNFLKYAEIKPDWWISHQNCEGDSGSKTSNSYQLNPEDKNVIPDIKTESKMDISESKTEISDIIDEECVKTNTNSE